MRARRAPPEGPVRPERLYEFEDGDDGRTIAFFSSGDGPPQLYLMNADGTQQHRLLNSSTDDREPSWSPGGHNLVFSRYTKTRVEIWTVRSDGTRARRLATACANTYALSSSDPCLDEAPSPTWRSSPAGARRPQPELRGPRPDAIGL
jgi:dipeptidyl aminopeptidase/acylaminoacyl peptidase